MHYSPYPNHLTRSFAPDDRLGNRIRDLCHRYHQNSHRVSVSRVRVPPMWFRFYETWITLPDPWRRRRTGVVIPSIKISNAPPTGYRCPRDSRDAAFQTFWPSSVCTKSAKRQLLFTGYTMHIKATYLQCASARVPKFEAAILMSCDDNLRVTTRSWRPFSARNGPLALWEASFFTCRCATNLKRSRKEKHKERESARNENTVEERDKVKR